MKKTLKSFQTGAKDKAFINKCNMIKRQIYSRKDKKIYNMFCIVVAAASLSNKDYKTFIKNVNELKNIGSDTRIRLYTLFLAYIIDRDYKDLWNELSTLSQENSLNEVNAIKLYKKYSITSPLALEKLKDKNVVLFNEQIKEIIEEFINTL